MDQMCPICLGVGWVCRSHPDKPWHEELGCVCDTGQPCECNEEEETDHVLDHKITRH
jgi:hypothetical protein